MCCIKTYCNAEPVESSHSSYRSSRYALHHSQITQSGGVTPRAPNKLLASLFLIEVFNTHLIVCLVIKPSCWDIMLKDDYRLETHVINHLRSDAQNTASTASVSATAV